MNARKLSSAPRRTRLRGAGRAPDLGRRGDPQAPVRQAPEAPLRNRIDQGRLESRAAGPRGPRQRPRHRRADGERQEGPPPLRIDQREREADRPALHRRPPRRLQQAAPALDPGRRGEHRHAERPGPRLGAPGERGQRHRHLRRHPHPRRHAAPPRPRPAESTTRGGSSRSRAARTRAWSTTASRSPCRT